jgi:hypothetical protein
MLQPAALSQVDPDATPESRESSGQSSLMNHDQYDSHRIHEVLRGKLTAHYVDAGRDQKSAKKDASAE